MLHLDPSQGPSQSPNPQSQLRQISKSNSWNRFLVIKDNSLQNVGLLTYLFGKVNTDASSIREKTKEFLMNNQNQFTANDATLIRQLSNKVGLGRDEKTEIFHKVISKLYPESKPSIQTAQETKKVDSIFNLEDVGEHKIPKNLKTPPKEPK